MKRILLLISVLFCAHFAVAQSNIVQELETSSLYGPKVKINQPLGLVRADASGNYTMQFQLRKDKERLNPEQWIGF